MAMPPRALWTGAVSFGLVNVPVRMYSAIAEHTLHFHYLHVKDDSRIGYYLGPQEGAEKVYLLLLRALEKSGLAAIAKYVMRDRQNLGCLRVPEGVVTLEQMYFADEIRPLDEIKPKKAAVDKRQLEMAAKLIESYSGKFEPGKYKDTYRDALVEIIKAKRKGEEIHVPEPEEPEGPPDLLAALRASVEAASARSRGRRAARSNGGAALEKLTKDELYERARDADIAGRSEMNRAQLIKALKAA